MSTGWDSSTLKKLKTLVGRGMSTAEIGRKLGMSKNAVVGKLNRLGWNAKAVAEPAKKTSKVETKKTTPKASVKAPVKPTAKTKSKTPVAKTTKTVAKAPKKTAVKEVVKKEPAPKTASKKTNKDLAVHQRIIQHSLEMANLKPNQCRWPIGDPDSEHFHFCGATVFAGKPYCYEHCRQAYQFTQPKKK
ncbi:MAG: GcrA family cell cycle regulator [Alphaproteobacteria bacterium]|nr:GcrA family cell cycle regulator [Alphaproteobacteria bacterium]